MTFKNHHVLILQRSKCCLIESNKNVTKPHYHHISCSHWKNNNLFVSGLSCLSWSLPWTLQQLPGSLSYKPTWQLVWTIVWTHSASLFSNKFMQITCTVFLNHSAEEHGTLMIYTTPVCANVTHTFIWFHQKKRHLHRSNQHRCEPSYCLLFQITCSSFE